MRTPLRLLVVEDDNLTRKLLVRVLSDEGFVVHDFGDGTSAIAALASGSVEVDIALVDLDLGTGPTGIDVLRAIRRDHQHVGAVILSSFHATQLVDSEMSTLPENIGHLVKADLDSDEKIVEALLAASMGDAGPRPNRLPGAALSITRAQAELLRLVSQGKSNAAIAQERQTTVRATEILLQRTYAALGIDQDGSINSRVQAAMMYRDSAITLK
ncbi:MAG: response regulator [Candidatus Nanopelagicales bacterium]